jgi:hypothetical protein
MSISGKGYESQIIHFNNQVISVFKSKTGVSFVFVGEHSTPYPLFEKVCYLYCCYVLRNPFYVLEMPVNCEKFDFYCKQLFKGY